MDRELGPNTVKQQTYVSQARSVTGFLEVDSKYYEHIIGKGGSNGNDFLIIYHSMKINKFTF